MNRRQRLMIAILAIAAAALVVPGFSSAAFTSQTSSTGTVSAAADWTPPTVSVLDPGPAVKGTTTVGVDATDAESGIQRVELQVQPAAGGTWTTICSTTTSPYSCAWDTTTRTDGAYLLRAIATDRAGYSTASATVRTTVANTLTVSIAALPETVRGTVTAQATVSNAGGLSPVVRIEYSVPGSGSWTTLCANLSSPYSCTAATGSIANGSYDVRAVAVVGTATYTSATVRTLVDNQAPTVTMTDPGTPLTGTRTFTATASDAHSGVDQVVIQYATGSTWSTLCTITTAPYTCSYDTSTLPNGTYTFRAVATDKAGNTTTSAATAGRAVTNVISSVTLADPGARLRGSVTLTATASSTGTISSVKFQRAPAGSTTWTDICTDTASPYTCSWNTTQVTDGAHDLRAVLTDSTGRTTVSTVVAGRTVDNTAPTGVDVQAVNGNGDRGRIDAGDVITFTYSELMDLNSILPGWDGTETPVSGTLTSGLLTANTIEFGRNNTRPSLGTIDLNANFGILLGSSTLGATMSASTTTGVGGVTQTTISLRITSGESRGAPGSTVSMQWTPTIMATDLAGNSASATRIIESGATRDVDF